MKFSLKNGPEYRIYAPAGVAVGENFEAAVAMKQ